MDQAEDSYTRIRCTYAATTAAPMSAGEISERTHNRPGSPIGVDDNVDDEQTQPYEEQLLVDVAVLVVFFQTKRSWVSVPQNVWILGIYKIGGAILGSVFRCALILGSFQPDAWDLGMNFLVGGF